MSIFSEFFRKNFSHSIVPPLQTPKNTLYKGGYGEGGGGNPTTGGIIP